MKRIVALICVLTFSVALFSGCSEENPNTDSSQTSTKKPYVYPTDLPNYSDFSEIGGAVDPDPSDPSYGEDVTPTLPQINLAMLSDEAALSSLKDSFEASRYHFDASFSYRQQISGAAGMLTDWNGTVRQLGSNKRCEYTFGGREYEACVVNGVYYSVSYDENGSAVRKKNTSDGAKQAYRAEQEANYETFWNLSLSYFANAALTRGNGYTVTCTAPTEDGVRVLASTAKVLGDPQVSAVSNVTVTASFDGQGTLTSFSVSFDMALVGFSEETVHVQCSASEISHDAASITVSLPENADAYKE